MNDKAGITAAVVYGGELVWFAGVGEARAADGSHPPVQPDWGNTVWRLGSVTKALTVWLLQSLEQAGKVRGSDRLSDHLPGFTFEDVTLDAVASQLGGMVHEPPLPCRPDDSKCDYTPEELMPGIVKQGQLWGAWERPSYSNLGFDLLGHALARAAGAARYEEAMGTLLFEPAGMDSTGFNFTSQVLARLALGPHLDEVPSDLGFGNPDGGAYTTTRDIVTFLSMLTTPNATALSAATRNRWLAPRYLLPDGVSGFGAPWEIMAGVGGKAAGRWLFTKSGNIDRFGSMIAIEPKARIGTFAAANRDGSLGSDVADRVNAVVISPLIAAMEEAAVAARTPPARAEQFVGIYKGYVSSLLSNMTVAVAQSGETQLQATFSWSTGGPLPAMLLADPQYPDSAVLQLDPQLPVPCLAVSELAWNGEKVLFAFESQGEGAASSLTMPGLLPPSVFLRQD